MAIIVLSLVVSKLLLQLVALNKKDGQYTAAVVVNGKDDDNSLLKYTAEQLNTLFHPTEGISILKSIGQIPDFVIDVHRRQCISDLLLDWLLDTAATFKNHNVKFLAVCNFDAYSNGLNFVFGQAHMNGKVAAVYLPRLKQEFYGLKKKRIYSFREWLKNLYMSLDIQLDLGIAQCIHV